MRRYVLTVICPDRVGIVAAVTGLLARLGGSVLEAAQHGDLATGMFFLRIEMAAESLPSGIGPDELRAAFGPTATEFAMEWKLSDTDVPKRVVLFVSQEDHCLADLLYRWRCGDIECDIPCVIANHEDLRYFVEWYGIPFRCVPVATEPAAKDAAFDELPRIVDGERTDVVVLARYMQILPPSMCEARPGASSTSTTPSCRPSPVPARTIRPSPRGQADRRHLSLRHGRPRRGPDHRAGHPAHRPRGRPDGIAPRRAGHRAHGAGPRGPLAPRGPGLAQRHKTVVFT